MAGGGVKGGHIYGSTDEFGYNATENVSTVYDMWATVLHLMGIDHEQLTYRFSGRDLTAHGCAWKRAAGCDRVGRSASMSKTTRHFSAQRERIRSEVASRLKPYSLQRITLRASTGRDIRE
jgi:hypothetical protein